MAGFGTLADLILDATSVGKALVRAASEAAARAAIAALGGTGGAVANSILIRGADANTVAAGGGTLTSGGVLTLDGSLVFSPVNGQMTIDQVWSIQIHTQNSLGLYSGSADDVTIRNGTASPRLTFQDAGNQRTLGFTALTATGAIEINSSVTGTRRDLLARNETLDGTLTFVSNGSISTTSGTLSVGENTHNTVLGGLWTISASDGSIAAAGNYPINWSGRSVGLYPSATGVLEINNMTPGTLATLTAFLRPAPYTFGTVPSASANSGSAIRITDRGGKWAYSDGTDWRFYADDAVIS